MPNVFHTDPERDEYFVSEKPLIVVWHWEDRHVMIDKISDGLTNEVIFDMAHYTTQSDYERRVGDIDMHNLAQLISDTESDNAAHDREDELAYGPRDTFEEPDRPMMESKLKNQEIKMSSRLDKLNKIVKAAPRVLVDEDNPNAVEEGFAPDLNIQEPSVEELPQGMENGMNPERLQLIQERHERMKRLKQKQLQKEHNEQREEFRNEDAAPFEVTAPERLVDSYKKELEEEQAHLGNPEYDQEIIQRNIESLKADIAELEAGEESWLSGMGKPLEVAEGPYDRATDVEKNQQAQDEMTETMEGVEGEEAGGRRKDYETFKDIEMDDVMVLADTMYSLKQAREALNNMPIEKLKETVLEKMNALGLNKNKKAVEAYLSGNYKTAGEIPGMTGGFGVSPSTEMHDEDLEDSEDDKDSERPEDLDAAKTLRDYSKMSAEEKVMGASYVELYALNKFFDKLLKKKKKAEPQEVGEDEAVDISQLEKAIGKKPKPEHGAVKKYTPEEIADYARKMQTASMNFSKRANAEECDECSGPLTSEDISEGKKTCFKCTNPGRDHWDGERNQER